MALALKKTKQVSKQCERSILKLLSDYACLQTADSFLLPPDASIGSHHHNSVPFLDFDGILTSQVDSSLLTRLLILGDPEIHPLFP